MNKAEYKKYQKAYKLKNKEKNIKYMNAYRIKNKEKITKQYQLYNLKNKKKIAKKQKEYNETNIDKRKKWREENKEKMKQYRVKNKKKMKEYRLKNKEKIAKQNKKWRIKNKDKMKIVKKKWNDNKYNTDIAYKITHLLRTRINHCLKNNNKSLSTMFLIGCEIDYLLYHIQEQFQDGMTWDNHGKGDKGKGMKEWHIDHIKPCASFNLSKPEEQQKCFHYSNLQPLWATENLKKKKRIKSLI